MGVGFPFPIPIPVKKVMVPLAGLIDLGAEKDRLRKEIERLKGEVQRITNKLSNEKFVANAPADVVDKERAKAADATGKLTTLEVQLRSL